MELVRKAEDISSIDAHGSRSIFQEFRGVILTWYPGFQIQRIQIIQNRISWIVLSPVTPEALRTI